MPLNQSQRVGGVGVATPTLVGSMVRRYPPPSGFRADEYDVLTGSLEKNGSCRVSSTYTSGGRKPGQERVRVSIVQRILEFNPATCTTVVASQVDTLRGAAARIPPIPKNSTVQPGLTVEVSVDGKNPSSASANFTRPGSLMRSQSLGAASAFPSVSSQACSGFGDPGYASQETVVEDPAYIDVNNDLNEVYFLFNGFCIASGAQAIRATRWLVATGWEQLLRGWYPWDWDLPDQRWLYVTTFSSYRNKDFPPCFNQYAYTNHDRNEVRLFGSGQVQFDATVLIWGAPCHLLLTWRTWRNFVT